MSRTVTLELSETMAAWLETSAHESGMSPSDWILFALTEQYRLQHHAEAFESSVPVTSPLAPTQSSDSGRAKDSDAEEARKRFRIYFGRLNSVDPHSADNEGIDDDLARAYAETPKDES